MTLRLGAPRCYSAGEPRKPGGWSRESPLLARTSGRRRGKDGARCAAETLRPTERRPDGPLECAGAGPAADRVMGTSPCPSTFKG